MPELNPKYISGALFLVLCVAAFFFKPISLSPSSLNLIPSLYIGLQSKAASNIRKLVTALQLGALILFIAIILIQKKPLEIPQQWQSPNQLVLIFDSSLFYQLNLDQVNKIKKELLLPFISSRTPQTTCIYGVMDTNNVISPCTRNLNYLNKQVERYPVYPNLIFNSHNTVHSLISQHYLKNTEFVIFYQQNTTNQSLFSKKIIDSPYIALVNVSSNKAKALQKPLSKRQDALLINLNPSLFDQSKTALLSLKFPSKPAPSYFYWPNQTYFIGLLLLLMSLEFCICFLAKTYRYV